MPSDYITKSDFNQAISAINKKLEKLDWIIEKLDWLMGNHRDHEEEHTLLNGKVSEHSDRLEKVEEKIGITA